MTIRQISVTEVLDENNYTLLEEYSKESKGSLLPSIKPNSTNYLRMEEMGLMDIVGLFNDDNMLVGFIVALTYDMPHYSKVGTTVESFFISKEARKYGTGKRLVEEISKISKDKGSEFIFLSAPIDGVLDKVAHTYGFTPTNKIFTKAL